MRGAFVPRARPHEPPRPLPPPPSPRNPIPPVHPPTHPRVPGMFYSSVLRSTTSTPLSSQLIFLTLRRAIRVATFLRRPFFTPLFARFSHQLGLRVSRNIYPLYVPRRMQDLYSATKFQAYITFPCQNITEKAIGTMKIQLNAGNLLGILTHFQ